MVFGVALSISVVVAAAILAYDSRREIG